MSHDFRDSFVGPVKNVAIHVAEFSCDNNEYLEGPRTLAQSIEFFPDQGRIEDVSYYADGTIHLRTVTTIEAGRSRHSVMQRYERDGELRDTWRIYYDQDGRRTRAEAFGPEGQFRGEFQAEERESVEPFDLGNTVMDSDESSEREVDAYGNWTREIRFRRVVENGEVAKIPTMATYRTITYFES